MRVTRRTLITSAAVGAGAAVLAAAARTFPALAASAPGDVVGKISVGYQGWFAATGDGSPINAWWHWSANWSQPPSPANNGSLRAWPDMREFTRGYQTAYANLGNGQPATLYSNYDQQTVDTQFLWMQQNSIDTAALQRFNPTGGEGPIRDAVTARVRLAAEKYSRKFYVMYDVTNWTNMQSEIKTDWTGKMSAYTASGAYARQNGKPVVCVWGFGFSDDARPFTPAACLDVVNWFKAQGCYVIGGVPTYWRQGINDSRAGFSDVYHAFHMISPWMVGRIGNVGDVDWFAANVQTPDVADCAAHGIDYQPCALPGDVTARQRAHGDFLWRQFYQLCRLGAQGIYISMYDEFNEGNQICKTAESAAFIPTNSGLLGLDEDGTACSSDYYLRLTGDGGRMLKGQLALTATRPTPPKPTGGGDTTAPSAPTNLHATGHTDSTVALAWNAATDNVGVTGYTVATAAGAALGSTAGTTFTVTGLAPATAYTFVVSARDAAGNVSAASGAVSVTTDPTPAGTTLALHKPATASSTNAAFVAGNAVDGDPNSYWESANNAFPQWIQVDLGSAVTVSRLVLKLPASWGSRSQTLAVSGSTDGSSFATLVGPASYAFDPAGANTVTVTFPAVSRRYARLTCTANSGWPAGQLSDLQVYAS
jgi:chitodextrinase